LIDCIAPSTHTRPLQGWAERVGRSDTLAPRAGQHERGPVLDGSQSLRLDCLRIGDHGERADEQRNEGQRRADYELRRAQVLLKRGAAEQAQQVFEGLIEREPANLRVRGSAAEGMLSLRQGARALRFAEEGLALARQHNDRDSEQYFLELVSAARKQVG
jgi:hypothetical protein